MAQNETLEKLFDRTVLRQQLKTRQRYRQTRHTYAATTTCVRPIAKRDVLPPLSYPPLTCRQYLDPDDLGSTAYPGFDADGVLQRPPVFYQPDDSCVWLARLQHLALAMTLPSTTLSVSAPAQLRSKLHRLRLQRLVDMYVERLRKLRHQGCAMFSSAKRYAQALYCPATGTQTADATVGTYPHCSLRRMCPFCWTHAYVVEPFFRLRVLLRGDLPPTQPYAVRKDCRLVCVSQSWTMPADSHVFALLAELQSRRLQLYRETPQTRRRPVLMGSVQLQYVEPPYRAGQPWLLHRRAVLVCRNDAPPFEYPYDDYNAGYTCYSRPPQMRHLRHMLGRHFHYPLAYLLSPTAIVRRLLDGYVLWPHGGPSGYELYTMRGKLDQKHAHYRRALGNDQEICD